MSEKLKILFLDDMEARHQAFRDYAENHIVTHVYTAEEAIKALERETFDAAALDHDLAEEHYQQIGTYVESGRNRSGRAVARWIAEHGTPKLALVHSFNPDGSREMAHALHVAGIRVVRAPFGPQSCRGWIEAIERVSEEASKPSGQEQER